MVIYISLWFDQGEEWTAPARSIDSLPARVVCVSTMSHFIGMASIQPISCDCGVYHISKASQVTFIFFRGVGIPYTTNQSFFFLFWWYDEIQQRCQKTVMTPLLYSPLQKSQSSVPKIPKPRHHRRRRRRLRVWWWNRFSSSPATVWGDKNGLMGWLVGKWLNGWKMDVTSWRLSKWLKLTKTKYCQMLIG